jgi:hypothetical protein
MAKVAWLDNFSESFAFAIGPLFFLYVVASLKGKIQRLQLLHLLPFFIYSVYNLLYIAQPTAYKYSAYVQAYFPELDTAIVYPRFHTDPLYLREYISELTVLHIGVYLVISFLVIVKAFQREHIKLFARKYKNLSWLRNFTTALFFLLLILVAVKISFGRDVGDYLVSSCLALIIYATSANVIGSSVFFTEHLDLR